MSLIRPELHVDTEQRQNLAPVAIGLLHIEQTKVGAVTMMGPERSRPVRFRQGAN